MILYTCEMRVSRERRSSFWGSSQLHPIKTFLVFLFFSIYLLCLYLFCSFIFIYSFCLTKPSGCSSFIHMSLWYSIHFNWASINSVSSCFITHPISSLLYYTRFSNKKKNLMFYTVKHYFHINSYFHITRWVEAPLRQLFWLLSTSIHFLQQITDYLSTSICML